MFDLEPQPSPGLACSRLVRCVFHLSSGLTVAPAANHARINQPRGFPAAWRLCASALTLLLSGERKGAKTPRRKGNSGVVGPEDPDIAYELPPVLITDENSLAPASSAGS